MALKRFQQFLEERKGKNGGDPAPKVKTEIVPDYHGKKSDTPPGGGKPYGPKAASGDCSASPKGEKNGESLADKGDKSLKYSPMTAYKNNADLKPIKAERKVKSEGFIDATEKLSPSDFAAYMAKKNSNIGSVHETVGKFTSLIKSNPSGVMALVNESRRNGYFKALLSEMLQCPEAMKIVAKLLGDKNEGAAAARRLVNAMNEMVAPPMHQTLGAGAPPKKGLPAPDMGGEEEDPMAGDLGDEEDPSAMGDEGDDLGDEGDDLGDDEEGGEEGLDGEDPLADEPDGDEDPDAMGGGEEDPMAGGGDPAAMGAKKPFDLKLPRPSMMHRMMKPESTSPAIQNFMQALQS